MLMRLKEKFSETNPKYEHEFGALAAELAVTKI